MERLQEQHDTLTKLINPDVPGPMRLANRGFASNTEATISNIRLNELRKELDDRIYELSIKGTSREVLKRKYRVQPYLGDQDQPEIKAGIALIVESDSHYKAAVEVLNAPLVPLTTGMHKAAEVRELGFEETIKFEFKLQG